MQFKVNLKVPLVAGIEGTWSPGSDERHAAWELYVEMVTRVAVQPLHDQEGSLREALTSLYELFGITRQILIKYGPAVAKPTSGDISFGRIAIAMLNGSIRPLLSQWHPRLRAYEETRPETVDSIAHERMWEEHGDLRREFERTRQQLSVIATLLGNVAGVDPVITEHHVSRFPARQAEPPQISG
ncbi:hypothetical protein [Salininema proteolyticum]|uniref:Uncharacterized protein n=1 Tax=Salininema proteolyticum TaxID=1607685 RepID=A0ABV8TXA5_9ACTN